MADLSSSAYTSPLKQGRKNSNFNTPQPSKGWYPATESVSKQSTSASHHYKKSMSKPNTAYQTQKKLPSTRDIAILHESRIFRTLLEKAALKKQQQQKSPKRDPILQDDEAYVTEFRPCVRRLASADRGSECMDENFTRARATGEFNYIYNPPQDPRPQGIKSFVVLPSASADENYRRIAKPGRHKSEVRRNPIVEGDAKSEIIKRWRKAGEKNDHQERLNDRKHLLPADRGRSCRGRVFRDATFSFYDTDISGLDNYTERVQTQPPRPLTAVEQKIRGSIKGVLEYEDGPNYRAEVVSDKCNKVRFSDIINNQESAERLFGRKKTLEY